MKTYLITLAQARLISEISASLDYVKNLIPDESPWRGELALQSAEGHALAYLLLGDDASLIYSDDGEVCPTVCDAVRWAGIKQEAA